MYSKFCSFTIFLGLLASQVYSDGVSVTRTSLGGLYAPGDLVFAEEFDNLDLDLWHHEINMDEGGGNHEFQIYDKLPENSYVRDGIMYIRPSLSIDTYFNGSIEEFYNGSITLDGCTGRRCSMKGNYPCINYPVVSARLRTKGSFSFLYGKVEVRAKLPGGDWTFPAIWMMPEESIYGNWPVSGEMDLFESRGNRKLFLPSGQSIGSEQMFSTLVFGPDQDHVSWYHTHGELNSPPDQGFDRDFHNYSMEWTPSGFQFEVDGVTVLNVQPPVGGFFEIGKFPEGVTSPWANNTNVNNPTMAPYDQAFHFIINVAVGSIVFPFETTPPAPWGNTPLLDFFNARDEWLQTWTGERHAMAIDYIRVYAV